MPFLTCRSRSSDEWSLNGRKRTPATTNGAFSPGMLSMDKPDATEARSTPVGVVVL
jgi:hypothetical protein